MRHFLEGFQPRHHVSSGVPCRCYGPQKVVIWLSPVVLHIRIKSRSGSAGCSKKTTRSYNVQELRGGHSAGISRSQSEQYREGHRRCSVLQSQGVLQQQIRSRISFVDSKSKPVVTSGESYSALSELSGGDPGEGMWASHSGSN